MNNAEHLLVIRPDGTGCAIYDDELAPVLFLCGRLSIRRASHVEPVITDGCTLGWQADLSPSGGPILGPFASRREALAAERLWLQAALAGGVSDDQ